MILKVKNILYNRIVQLRRKIIFHIRSFPLNALIRLIMLMHKYINDFYKIRDRLLHCYGTSFFYIFIFNNEKNSF